uniref:G_PROTEIN_RECEP_F1_2 domain-containing protein n=1 Tax=Meloidogyne incognita TaxID=6306 RepID=A0A914N2P5_MELIC
MENLSILINKSKEEIEEDEVGDKMTVFEEYFYLVNGLIGTFLNLIVLLIAYLNVNINDKPRQIIVINMTLADLLTCTIYIITRSYVSIFPQFLCYPYYVLIVTSQLCSCLNLLCKRRVIWVMIGSWALIFGFVIFLYWFMEIKVIK